MFAVLRTGGKQYKVASGDILRVEKLAAEAGDTVQFNDILLMGGTVGAPLVSGAAVQAEVIEQIKGEKVINFVRRRRKHSSKRTKGHRQQLTLLRITELVEKGADKTGVKAAIGAGSVSASAAAEAPAKKAAAPKKAAAKPAAKPASKDEAPKAEKKAAAPKADKADDLTKLSGVGKVLAGKLNDAGVTTFAQIAAWTEADVAEMDEKLDFKGRIDREGWVEQAKDLAAGK
ncbi:50S ribosomal protein L21 [Pseudoroseicyclus sp. CXY001]|uniref:50S ribosomal protein L21 n=1 Tax=Pseudoroseicyclus sp. CXY001 TaxID=3242492 RepID=UPI0035709DF3